jgi:class 3 adenylate cyclase
MSDLLSTIAPYIPPTLLRAILSDPQVPVEPSAERFPAAVLFADVSGFTPLTEALAQKGAEGPEELTRLLNRYFGRIIGLIEAQGGEVVKFSGDAVTVLFAAVDEPLSHAVRRAQQSAEALQAAIDEFVNLKTSVGTVALRMKISIGAGEVLAMQVGGVLDRWEYVIAGDPLRQVAQAESQAKRGEIVLSPEAAGLLHPDPLPPRPLQRPNWSSVADPAALQASLRCYVPGSILGWLEKELYDWLAVLRPMSVLFVRVTGLEYEREDILDRLHAFMQAVQQTLYRYHGTLDRLAVDDKGTVMLVLIGAPPFAHADDPLRAVRCALDLQASAAQPANGEPPLQLTIGVTTGRVFAGPVGGETRCEYTVMGDTVNLAARLMVQAGAAGVLCDFDTYQQARERVTFESLPPIRVKGKAGLIRVYQPTGQREAFSPEDQPLLADDAVLINRETELARLTAALDAVKAGQARVLVVQGEAGIGKSRLVRELTRGAREQGLAWLLGGGQSIEQGVPYRAWRDVLAYFFGLSEITNPAERQTRVRGLVQELAPEQVERLPLLNDVLNLNLPDTDLTQTLDPDLRQGSLLSLLLALLQAWTQESPLILVLEDASGSTACLGS